MMKECADVGRYHGQSGWTKEGWQAMKNRLNERPPGANFTVQQLKDREQRLKKELNVVKSIVEKSGFGWDPHNKVPTTIDEKWTELQANIASQMEEGKNCKRTTDGNEERYNNVSHFPEHGSYTDDVLRAAGMNSPEATLSAPGSSMPEYELGRDIYGDDVDLSYAVEDLMSVDSPQRKRLRNSKGSDDGSEKKMQTYKEMKTKQIDRYKEINMAQMERNDPKNDPYGMQNCIQKLKNLGLTPNDQHKMINHLKADMLNRQTFMEVEDDVLSVIIQEVVAPRV
ncbi:hypothetical protein VPH35_072947 [Triticum aestivum]